MALGSDGSIYVGGQQSASVNKQMLLIHKFSKVGLYQCSFYATDPAIPRLNLWAVSGVLLTTSDDNVVYAMQPVSCILSRYSSLGQLIDTVSLRPDNYIAPKRLPNRDMHDKGAYERWIGEQLSKWTQTYQLLNLQNIGILAAFTPHTEDRYLLTMRGYAGQVIVDSVSSIYRPLFSDGKGMVFFIDTSDRSSKKMRIVVHKYIAAKT
jgi:hypothetical protein